MRNLGVCILVLASALAVFAETKTLVERNRIATTVSFEGYKNFALPTACDGKGRMYVRLTEAGNAGMVGPLLRVSREGVLEAEFDTSKAVGTFFAVRPNGGVAMLRREGTTSAVDNFGPDGKREKEVKLQAAPVPFSPLQMAVFASGEIFVAGSGRKASAAVYDSSGRLLKQLDLEEYATAGQHGVEHNSSRDISITGDDGYVYFLRSSSPPTVLVISASGDVLQRIRVNLPIREANAAFLPSLGVASGAIVIGTPARCHDDGGCEGRSYQVIDARTGQVRADYFGVGKEIGSPFACYLPDPDRFLSFWIPLYGHRLEIVESQAK